MTVWDDDNCRDERKAVNDERDDDESGRDERKARSKLNKVKMALGGSTEDARDDIYHDEGIGRDERSGHKQSIYKCEFCSCVITVLCVSVSIIAFYFSHLGLQTMM